LSPASFLSIDNFGFKGKMLPDNGFESFHKAFYRRQFSSPKYNADYPADVLRQNYGFRLHNDIYYEHFVDMSREQFVAFLRTQSNLQLCDSTRSKDSWMT
jgi:hypothetical protein